MADQVPPYVPADPTLVDAVRNPHPVVTEDPAKIAAMDRHASAAERAVGEAARQASATEAQAAAGVQLAKAVSAFAGIDSTPYPDHEVFLRAMLAALANPVFFRSGDAPRAADEALAAYKQRFPTPAATPQQQR